MTDKKADRIIKKGTCWIIGAGPCSGLAAEGFAPGKDDYIIAADGGLRYLKDVEVKPDMIVGDFDTLGYEPEHENVVRLQVEKDWTDTFVAMEKGAELGYETFAFLGCLGGKLEHTIANLQHMAWLARRNLTGIMMDGRTLVLALHGSGETDDVSGGQTSLAKLSLPARDHGMVSVFSMSDRCEGVTIRGLKYTLDGADLTSSFPLGVSNEFTGEPAEISVKKGTLLVVIERFN